MPRIRGTEPIRLLLVAEGGDGAEEWMTPLERADLPVEFRVVATPEGAAAAVRDPFDLVVAWDDAAGRRVEEVAARLAADRCTVPLVAVTHPDAGVPEIGLDPGVDAGAGPGAGPGAVVGAILDSTRPELLPQEVRRCASVAEVALRNALSERIAHDLSNLLAPIPLALQLLRLPSPGGDALNAVDTSTRRAMGAVKDLSALLTAPEDQPVRIGAKHLLILASRVWAGAGHGVLTDYPPDLGSVRVRGVAFSRLLWCCARREMDRAGRTPGDLVFLGRNLEEEGEVELRLGCVSPAEEEGGASLAARPVAEEMGSEGGPPAGLADLVHLVGAVAREDGTLEALLVGERPAGFRIRLPAHRA